MGWSSHTAVGRGVDEGSTLALVDGRLTAVTAESTEDIGQCVGRRGHGPQSVPPAKASLPAHHRGILVGEVEATDGAFEPVTASRRHPGEAGHVDREHWGGKKRERREN